MKSKCFWIIQHNFCGMHSLIAITSHNFLQISLVHNLILTPQNFWKIAVLFRNLLLNYSMETLIKQHSVSCQTSGKENLVGLPLRGLQSRERHWFWSRLGRQRSIYGAKYWRYSSWHEYSVSVLIFSGKRKIAFQTHDQTMVVDCRSLLDSVNLRSYFLENGQRAPVWLRKGVQCKFLYIVFVRRPIVILYWYFTYVSLT